MKDNNQQLLGFMKGERPDHQGRMIEDIWALPSFWLEHTHDYIQWLFPIPEASRFNQFAPVLTLTVQEAFSVDEFLKTQQQQSLDVMLAFFGLEHNELAISARSELSIETHIWLKAGGHNHLRITRIIRSLAFQTCCLSCTKISTEAGPIDAVFISPSIRLTLVECKL